MLFGCTYNTKRRDKIYYTQQQASCRGFTWIVVCWCVRFLCTLKIARRSKSIRTLPTVVHHSAKGLAVTTSDANRAKRMRTLMAHTPRYYGTLALITYGWSIDILLHPEKCDRATFYCMFLGCLSENQWKIWSLDRSDRHLMRYILPYFYCCGDSNCWTTVLAPIVQHNGNQWIHQMWLGTSLIALIKMLQPFLFWDYCIPVYLVWT